MPIGKINNATVKLSPGDLMLCKDCDLYRFPPAASADAMNISNVSEVPVTRVADRKQETDRKLAVCEVLCFFG